MGSIRQFFARLRTCTIAGGLLLGLAAPAAAAPDPAFTKWLEGLWPDVQKQGVSRGAFTSATHQLEPDLTLPDLESPWGKTPPPAQAEFVQTFGVSGNVLLAIWGRETAFGGYKLPKNAITVLATQAYYGRRKDMFRQELLFAFKMLEEGHVKLADMRSSWGGAMGLTQFLPSEFYKYAVDFDGDGKKDIWNSVPDALASAAAQLVGKGWQPGMRWAYEVHTPRDVDCTIGVPEVTQPVSEWLQQGYVPAHGRRPSVAELSTPASLLLPEGTYGPAFLTLKNYYVIKDYNFSDLYVLFVGHLSDRISDPRGFETPWSKNSQLKTRDVETMQQTLTRLGLYKDKIDGKAGMLTRAA